MVPAPWQQFIPQPNGTLKNVATGRYVNPNGIGAQLVLDAVHLTPIIERAQSRIRLPGQIAPKGSCHLSPKVTALAVIT